MHLFNFIFALLPLLTLTIATPLVGTSISLPLTDPNFEETHNTTLPTHDLSTRQAGHIQNWPGPNYKPHFGAPYCLKNRPENHWECILTSRMPPGNSMHFEVYLFDHSCVLLGYDLKVPYWKPWGLTSQLPYLVTIENPQGGQIHFRYAYKYIYYNTGKGKHHELLPASQIFWNCSLDH